MYLEMWMFNQVGSSGKHEEQKGPNTESRSAPSQHSSDVDEFTAERERERERERVSADATDQLKCDQDAYINRLLV